MYVSASGAMIPALWSFFWVLLLLVLAAAYFWGSWVSVILFQQDRSDVCQLLPGNFLYMPGRLSSSSAPVFGLWSPPCHTLLQLLLRLSKSYGRYAVWDRDLPAGELLGGVSPMLYGTGEILSRTQTAGQAEGCVWLGMRLLPPLGRLPDQTFQGIL